VACHAGTQPNKTPDTIAAATVKISTGTLSRMSTSDGSRYSGIAARNARIRATASPTPTRPPSIASRTLSARNWRTIARGDAPSDARSATSRWRTAPRASSRLATFAQAIRSRKPTPASRNQSPRIVFRDRKLFCSGSTLTPQPFLASGNSSAIRFAIRAMSALACSSVTPGLSRPITVSQWKSWLTCSGVKASGT
jgi:hypothetical protein